MDGSGNRRILRGLLHQFRREVARLLQFANEPFLLLRRSQQAAAGGS